MTLMFCMQDFAVYICEIWLTFYSALIGDVRLYVVFLYLVGVAINY